MAKKIPSRIVGEYIKKSSEAKELEVQIDKLKKQLRDFHARGFESPELRFDEGTQYSPDWKTLVDELTTKYLNPAQKRMYYRKLRKRFPPKEKAATIRILSEDASSSEGSKSKRKAA